MIEALGVLVALLLVRGGIRRDESSPYPENYWRDRVEAQRKAFEKEMDQKLREMFEDNR